jgi:hypothetical protein
MREPRVLRETDALHDSLARGVRESRARLRLVRSELMSHCHDGGRGRRKIDEYITANRCAWIGLRIKRQEFCTAAR